ncbi:hypothetical protein EJ04DRAFT_452711 [Polyplosphaeria fusca]|uniref:C2H2-type domain-containing protein n=1 Tax=Polyplosphaeria fusca TaxID=682080 RepID=A0A9P4UVE2_9PLEO|nr:hypothetical protein EJ04DRAFT_452711 [Polyplosphaeria fusca]
MVAKNYADAFNALLEAYLEIGENIPQLTQYQQLFETNPYMQLALASIHEDILEFHKEALRYFRQRKWKELFHATWRSFSNTVAHLSKNLHRHKNLIESQASIIQFEALQDLRTQSQRHFEEQNMAELDRRRLSVLQWLCAVDVQARQEYVARLRYGRTGQWLLNDPRFVKWFSIDYCAEPLLWLNGIPGAGKTVLASLVIQKCRELPKAKTGFFYCRHSDNHRSAFVGVARAILSQLVAENELLLQYLYVQAANSGEVVLSSSTTAKALLMTALETCDKSQKTYIVIDGLDEYNREDRKEITTWFKEQVRNVPANIEAYCKSWHQLIAQRFGPLHPEEHNITEIITARAQVGMFLYAKLVTWNLYEQPNRKKFLEEIRPDRLPDGLEQAYARIIERIIGPTVQPRSRSENAKKLLGWLACAKRTLKWHEIQGAVSIDLEDGTISSDLQFRGDCKDICASLVDIDTDGSVVLVHSTHFNASADIDRYLIDKGHVCVPEVEFHLAHLCLAYLSFDQFLLGASQAAIQNALYQGDYAFTEYASCFWALHLIAGLREISSLPLGKTEELIEAISVFLEVQWASPIKTLGVSKTTEDSLSALAPYEFYNNICQAVVSTKNQLLPTGKGPSDDEALHLAEVIQAIRKELETIGSAQSTTPAEKQVLEQFYSSNWYKCRRINCQFYSQGFPTQSQRDHHISKHERSFTCTEEGCPQAVIGCATAKDLQTHMKDYHGTELEVDPEYPEDELEPDVNVRRVPKHPAVFQCTLCPKRFTRAYNLRSHQRVHTDERPFVCSVCGKAFARQHDRRRHEIRHAMKD